MENFKGTKGKWVVGVVPEYNDTLKSAMLEVQSAYYWVCKVQNNGMIQSEEGKANAQLISHAPEMLEAMQSFVNGFECDYVLNDGTIVDDPYEWLIEEYRKCKDLLKRATTI